MKYSHTTDTIKISPVKRNFHQWPSLNLMIPSNIFYPRNLKVTRDLNLLQDVLDSKNTAIKDLQYELARVCKVGDNLNILGL